MLCYWLVVYIRGGGGKVVSLAANLLFLFLELESIKGAIISRGGIKHFCVLFATKKYSGQ